VQFLEGAGGRGTAELVAAEIVSLLRTGTSAERIGVVCDSVDRWRPLLDATLPPLGIPYVVEHRVRLGETPLGRALNGLLRFTWTGGKRGELFSFLRSPFSGLERRAVDYIEGRLRGRAIADPARVEEESEKLRGAPLPALAELRSAADPVAGVRAVLHAMVRNAWGLEAPPTGEDARGDSRAFQAAERTLEELAAFAELDGHQLSPEDVLMALESTAVRPLGVGEKGRVAVLDYARARTRVFDAVFLLGLEEGSYPRRDRPSPFLDDDMRRELGGRLERPDSISRDRYLFYTACTRARERLVLVREAANDEGVPREPSPFWADVRSLFDAEDVARATHRRSLASLTWRLESAPSERERLRALVNLVVEDAGAAAALAAANGWSRRLDRATSAFERTTRLTSPAVLSWMSERTAFSVTELERFADCSSAWFVEKVIDPKTIDAEPDALLRGQVVHTTLNRFYSSLPRELDAERVTPANLEAALGLVRRCLDDALESGVRLDLTELQQAELRQTLVADLEGFVRDEAASEVRFVPRRLEVAFGSDRAAPELQRGLSLGDGLSLSGKIDRIDLDPFSARGIVQDYKSGVGAPSAREIDRERRLQIPLYSLVLRDLVGVEPLGGIYRALSGKRVTRGMLRESAHEDLPGFSKDDYLDEERFWELTETARARAAEYGQRIRGGDVRHDPKGDGCPSWCDLWPICRVERP
jgi:ATP-dependent helicase/DNAse subunit B